MLLDVKAIKEIANHYGDYCPSWVIVTKQLMVGDDASTIAYFDLDSKAIVVNTRPISPTRGAIPLVGEKWEEELGQAIAHEIQHYVQLNRCNGDVDVLLSTLFVGDYSSQQGEIEADAVADALASNWKRYLAKKIM